MANINLEKLQVPLQQEDPINVSALLLEPHKMALAIFFLNFKRILKENIELLQLEGVARVSERSIKNLEEQNQEHREDHRRLDAIKKHRETPQISKKV